MSNNINHFNNAAKTWDDDPLKIARAKAVAKDIVNNIKLSDKMSAMEFGSGTGQLSFMLQPYLNSLILIDESTEMLKVADEKIKFNNISNMTTKTINILKENCDLKFDLIYTLMVLHHVKETEVIIAKFHSLLNTGGFLCIADLVEEDGSFHSHMPEFDGHNGYNLDKLGNILKSSGFTVKNVLTSFTITKETKSGNKDYPVFLMIAQK
jgi:2-polyprenyl-3-methyl-5-hydroxy-6-metoxy-1,4-benzoquinol methylase